MDSALATAICMGVVLPESMGLGGGCFINSYNATTQKATVYNGRETAPSYATEAMFEHNSTQSLFGPLSIGIPGELAAYWEAHKGFGKLPWMRLWQPSIKLAEEGFYVGEHLAMTIGDQMHYIVGTRLE